MHDKLQLDDSQARERHGSKRNGGLG